MKQIKRILLSMFFAICTMVFMILVYKIVMFVGVEFFYILVLFLLTSFIFYVAIYGYDHRND